MQRYVLKHRNHTEINSPLRSLKERSLPFAALALLLAPILAVQAQTTSISLEDPDQIKLTWNTEGSGTTYTVQSLDRLDGQWYPVGDPESWPSSQLDYQEPWSPASTKFYRVVGINRGRLVAAESQQTISPLLILFGAALLGVDIMPQFEVTVYRIEYETTDAFLGPTIASGIVALPNNPDSPLPLVSYQHGTIYLNSEAPSSPTAPERLIAGGMASLGYAAVMPDLLGFGTDADSFHPFVHRRSQATAVVDLLRAARHFIATQPDVELNGQVMLMGYSQGGHATMAAQKEIEERHADEFALVASAPMAGPYSISGVMARIMFRPQAHDSPAYLPYSLVGYQAIYPSLPDFSSMVKAPFDEVLPPLFDGNHTGAEIAAAMPSAVPRDLFEAAFIAAYEADSNHPLRRVLRDNDVLDWAPRTPTRLFHCAGDTTVPLENAHAAIESFVVAGADPEQVQLVDPNPAGDHISCVGPSINEVITWFESLR